MIIYEYRPEDLINTESAEPVDFVMRLVVGGRWAEVDITDFLTEVLSERHLRGLAVLAARAKVQADQDHCRRTRGDLEPPVKYGAARVRPGRIGRTRLERLGMTECIACGAIEDLTIDHIVPRSRGGSNDQSNLQCLCRSCNASKGARTMEEWRRAKR